jgi:hypothetical protein
MNVGSPSSEVFQQDYGRVGSPSSEAGHKSFQLFTSSKGYI